jgi:hypothetical protein
MMFHKRLRRGLVALVVATVACAVCVAPAAAADYFFEDFDSYSTDAEVTGAGFQIESLDAIELMTQWTITNPSPRANPPTIDGTPTTGNFMVADSDAQTESGLAGSTERHNLVTPSFSTVGGGSPWLHVDASIMQNNNGLNVFFIDVSVDGGTNWATRFTQMAPARANFDYGTNPVLYQPDNTNVGGYFGRLDVDLGPEAANQPDVQVRFQMYEPNWDWWYAIDNVKVDDVPKPFTGTTIAYAEDFSSRTLGTMGVINVIDDENATFAWVTKDNAVNDTTEPIAPPQYYPGQVGDLDGRSVGRIGHPDPVGENGELTFAITEGGVMAANADPLDPVPPYHTILHTPVLDLSDVSGVVIEFEDEGYAADEVTRVLLMEDTNGDGPDASDTVVRVIFDYLGGGGFVSTEEPMYAERAFDVPEADGRDDVYFAWESASAGGDAADALWWAIDSITVSGGGGDVVLGDVNLDGEVNGLDVDPFVGLVTSGTFQAEGDMNDDGVVNGLDVDPFVAAVVGGGAQAVPEPGTLGLLVLGGLLSGLLVSRRRRK